MEVITVLSKETIKLFRDSDVFLAFADVCVKHGKINKGLKYQSRGYLSKMDGWDAAAKEAGVNLEVGDYNVNHRTRELYIPVDKEGDLE